MERISARCESLLTHTVAEDAVAPDAHEAVGQHMPKVALQESHAVQAYRNVTFAALRVTTPERDDVSVVRNQSAIRDGDPSCVSGEVLDHLLGSCEGPSYVDVPGLPRCIAKDLVS